MYLIFFAIETTFAVLETHLWRLSVHADQISVCHSFLRLEMASFCVDIQISFFSFFLGLDIIGNASVNSVESDDSTELTKQVRLSLPANSDKSNSPGSGE